MARLSDINVLVAAADGPLGAALIGRLVAEGATVIAAYGEPAGAPAERVRRVELDPTDAESWQRCIDRIRDDLGALHGLVHAGGPVQTGPLSQMPAADVTATIDANLLGPALGIRTASPLLADSGGGSIVTIASTEALRGSPNAAVYSATNWGLRGLTRSAALELGSLGIRVNTVCPSIGLMAAEATAEAAPSALVDGEAERAVTMGDVAAMVVFLLSDDSATCTGGDFLVDAGATA